MRKNEQLENRLEEWARWCLSGGGMPGIGYSPIAAGGNESVKQDRSPVACDDREMQVERLVSALAEIDAKAAEVLRAEYRAHEKYGNAHYEESGNNCGRTHKQLGIAERTYSVKLEKAKAVVRVGLLTGAGLGVTMK